MSARHANEVPGAVGTSNMPMLPGAGVHILRERRAWARGWAYRSLEPTIREQIGHLTPGSWSRK